MKPTIKDEILAHLLLKVIDENKNVEESSESEEWILGYHEACDMVLEFIGDLQKHYGE